MTRQISRAESWERAHEVFQQVNFNSYDFNTIKESLLDYMKLYFPEDFNDYIESSEFIALLELFAYIAEQVAYRQDMNAHENLLPRAVRKESILRLAKLISYKASRIIPARGLVKINSIRTTESILDSKGANLANVQIQWNDSNNSDWREQFILIMNQVLEQEFGTVLPTERVQVNDVLFELYSLNNTPLSTDGKSVFPYTAPIAGSAVNMELVPVTLTDDGPKEKRLHRNMAFSLLYSSDGLGDSSDMTGFLAFTKQGTINVLTTTFDGITPNQTLDVAINNINETDVVINNINSSTGEVLTDDPYENTLPHLVSEDLGFGEWIEVDVANAQNIIFNTNKNRHKFEIETLTNDQIRIVFGDGEFADIPKGTFDIWYRTSTPDAVAIPKSTVTNQVASFTYLDGLGNIQTFTFSFGLVSSLLNGSPSEDLEHIRRVAPSVYYTQDRMVNGKDYNTFMLQDPSIVKNRAINRTFAGDSKYIAWHDPKEYYENVKIFGDDLALYWKEEDPAAGNLLIVTTALTVDEIFLDYLEPLLSTTDFFLTLGSELEQLNADPGDIRRRFINAPYSFDVSDNEIAAITNALTNALTNTPIVDLYYSALYDEWTVGGASGHPCDLETSEYPYSPPNISGCERGPATSIWMVRIDARFEGSTHSGWDIRYRTKRLESYSVSTNFWNPNTIADIINFDTLDTKKDRIVILSANENANQDSILSNNINYHVVAQGLVEQNLPNAGLLDQHKLALLPEDKNADNVSDSLIEIDLFDFDLTQLYDVFITQMLITGTGTGSPYNPIVMTLPHEESYLVDQLDQDIEIYVDGIRYTNENGKLALSSAEVNTIIRYQVEFTQGNEPQLGNNIRIIVRDYVYFSRVDVISKWVPQIATNTIRAAFALEDVVNIDERKYKRHLGRYPLNFGWFHTTEYLHLIDPAASNIIDNFIITKGYYLELQRWLERRTNTQPVAPTPLELRTSYSSLMDNKMISDTLILQSGKFKILFGANAVPQLRGIFKIVRPVFSSRLTDNEVKVRVVSVIRQFFDIDIWEFGETFFFTELAASIHASLGSEIDSVVLVPTYSQNQFGDMFQVQAQENQLFIADVVTSDIEVIQSLTPENIRQN